jgi:hypothetical protein
MKVMGITKIERLSLLFSDQQSLDEGEVMNIVELQE